MSFYIFAWMASILYGFVAFIAKLTSKYSIKNVWFFTFVWILCILLISIPVALLNNAVFPTKTIYILVASLGNALFYIFYNFALYNLDITTLTPLFNLRVIMTLFLSFLILHEKINPNQYLWVILIILGGFFVSVDGRLSIKSFF